MELFSCWTWLHLICLTATGLAQSFDPLKDFCRLFAHQTAIIDRKLYIDGGLANYQDVSQNYTNTYLLYADLDVLDQDFPREFANLSKPSNVPLLQGGVLWADTVNKIFYLYGGEYQTTPEPFTLWSYDTIYNEWNATSPDDSNVQRASFGAGVTVESDALGFYYGGWLSNASVRGWTGDRLALSNMLTYDMIQNTWTNASGPDSTPRAEGVMIYIPASDRGMLVYFGGIQTPYGSGNNTWIGEPMNNIHLYDIASSKWYTQNATGEVPDMRRRFCAGVTWAEDQSSYNIYLYGGASMPPNTTGFDDVYILSIPSFSWIKWYPSNNAPGFPHHSLTCNVIDNSQMIVMGGTFPASSRCDDPKVHGQHNLNLGKDNAENAMWYRYLPNVTSYQVPPEITAAIGGGPTGSATMTIPSGGWDGNDLSVYFTRRYTAATRTPTRAIPTSTAVAPTLAPTHTTSPKHNDIGAIVGGTVGGVVAVIIGFVLACLCVRSRRKRKNTTPAVPSAASMPQMATVNKPLPELANPSPTSPGSFSDPYKTVSHRLSPASEYAPQYHEAPPAWVPQPPPSPLRPYPLLPQQNQVYYPPPPGHQADIEMPTVRSPVGRRTG